MVELKKTYFCPHCHGVLTQCGTDFKNDYTLLQCPKDKVTVMIPKALWKEAAVEVLFNCHDCQRELAELEAHEEEIREAEKHAKKECPLMYDVMHADAKAHAERKFTQRGLTLHCNRVHKLSDESMQRGIEEDADMSSRFRGSNGRSVLA